MARLLLEREAGLMEDSPLYRLNCASRPPLLSELRFQATPLLDYVLFNRFRTGFGGRVRFIVSGGAPLSTSVAEFLAVALCSPVFQARPARLAMMWVHWS